MKETRSLTLSGYELITSVIDINNINNKVLKFFLALVLIPLFLSFVFVSLCIEEPLKCLGSLVLMKTTPKKVWIHYKKCWSSLLGGYNNGN